MTAREIGDRLIENTKGVTAVRVQKARALAFRSGIDWADVLKALEPHERELVEQAA